MRVTFPVRQKSAINIHKEKYQASSTKEFYRKVSSYDKNYEIRITYDEEHDKDPYTDIYQLIIMVIISISIDTFHFYTYLLDI
ncbi:MAG: hypothetical protein Q8880_11560 [Bacteroidota bacterium]|nr:hypothetical protein [Bacteroidota bacterium]